MSERSFLSRLFGGRQDTVGSPELAKRPGDFFADAKTALSTTSDRELQEGIDRIGVSKEPKPGAFLNPIMVADVRSAAWQELPFPNNFWRRYSGNLFDDSQVFEAQIPGFARTIDISELPDEAKIIVERREHEPRTQAEMVHPRPVEYVVKVIMPPPPTDSAYLIYSWDQITGGKKFNSITPASQPVTLLRGQEFANSQALTRQEAIKAGFKVALIEKK